MINAMMRDVSCPRWWFRKFLFRCEPGKSSIDIVSHPFDVVGLVLRILPETSLLSLQAIEHCCSTIFKMMYYCNSLPQLTHFEVTVHQLHLRFHHVNRSFVVLWENKWFRWMGPSTVCNPKPLHKVIHKMMKPMWLTWKLSVGWTEWADSTGSDTRHPNGVRMALVPPALSFGYFTSSWTCAPKMLFPIAP